MPGSLRALETGAGLRNKFGVVFGEWRGGQFQKDVVLNPLLKVANWKQNSLRLVAVVVLLLKAGVKGFELLLGLHFGQQESMADADFVFGKSLDNFGCKLRQTEAGSDVCGTLPAFGADLFDTVLRLFEPHQGGEALRFVEGMYIASLQIFNDAGFKSLGIAEFNDANRRSFESDNLGGAETPGPCDNLEMLTDLANNQRREDALRLDALGQLSESCFIESAAGVACRLCQAFKRKIAILRCGDHMNLSFRCSMG